MKKELLAILFFIIITLTGCELILDIFKAGFWTGIIIVVIVVALIIWMINKMRK